MKKWERYTYILRQFMYLVFLYDIVSSNMGNRKSLIIFTTLFLLIVINDYLRFYYLYKKSEGIYYISIVVSIIIAAILAFFIWGYINVYLYITIVDIAFLSNKRAVKYLSTLNILVLVSIPLLQCLILDETGILEFFKIYAFDYLILCIYLLFYITSVFSFRALIIEKNRVEKLNKEIEELTITKERNRVAQEIHDNLGHSLVALNMNLDVAYNVIDKDMDKTKELIDKCQNLAQDSMDSLRKAVYALKDEDISKGLIKSIEKLVYNIEDENNMKVNLNIDEEIENYSPEYKNLIYTIIKESITNSIKHGKGDKIHIELEVNDEIILRIKDNGIGCDNIIKGNGLMGIEERVNKFNGDISYISKKSEGFELIFRWNKIGN